MDSADEAIVMFDGVCRLCNGAVRFILKRDKRRYFKYTPLQSATAKALMENSRLPPTTTDSILLWEKGCLYSQSTAALKICRHLSGLWPAATLFLLVPRFLRDGVYRFIARNRYRWFGQKKSCELSELQGWRDRFLE